LDLSRIEFAMWLEYSYGGVIFSVESELKQISFLEHLSGKVLDGEGLKKLILTRQEMKRF